MCSSGPVAPGLGPAPATVITHTYVARQLCTATAWEDKHGEMFPINSCYDYYPHYMLSNYLNDLNWIKFWQIDMCLQCCKIHLQNSIDPPYCHDFLLTFLFWQNCYREKDTNQNMQTDCCFWFPYFPHFKLKSTKLQKQYSVCMY